MCAILQLVSAPLNPILDIPFLGTGVSVLLRAAEKDKRLFCAQQGIIKNWIIA